MRRSLLTLGVVAVAAAPAMTAQAAPSAVSQAATALRRSPGVYVASAATGHPLAISDAQRVRQAVAAASTPIFVAVLGEPNHAAALSDLHSLILDVGRRGTYVVVGTGGFVAGSDVPGVEGSTGTLVQQAVGTSEQPADELISFVHRVDAAASRSPVGTTGTTDGTGTSGDGSSGTRSWLPVVVVLGLLAGAVVLLRRRRLAGQQADAAALAQVRSVAEQDVTVLGEQLARVSIPPAGSEEATADYQSALDAYERAKQELAAARHPGDLGQVTAALEEGRWRLACVQARLAGRPLPERRPPCFFNPQHGPSTTDALWSPDGGAPREVPVCAADAVRIARGEGPASRLVPSGRGGLVPYWQAPAFYGPYAGGFFGGWGGGSFLGGLLAGELLTGGLGGGWGGYDAGYDAGYATGQDAGPGGGDFAGGFDTGGADWGGGFDTGGGDFGGGDFGGGDGGGW